MQRGHVATAVQMRVKGGDVAIAAYPLGILYQWPEVQLVKEPYGTIASSHAPDGVDVGVVEIREQGKRVQTEIDFVCNMGNNRYYIQSALNLNTSEKTVQESRPLNHIGDNFKKIIVVKDPIKPWRTKDGILVLGILDFLLNPNSLDI